MRTPFNIVVSGDADDLIWRTADRLTDLIQELRRKDVILGCPSAAYISYDEHRLHRAKFGSHDTNVVKHLLANRPFNIKPAQAEVREVDV